MSQQINLYSPVFRRQKKYFSAATMAVSLGIALAGIILLSVYARLQVTTLAQQAQQSTRTVMDTATHLQAMAAAQTGEARQKALQERIKEAESALATGQRLAAALKSSGLGNTSGFSETLRAFARQRVNGVWLTQIGLDTQANELFIAGKALRPELVPEFVAKLGQEPGLRGRAFDVLEIRRATPDKDNPAADKSATRPTQGEVFDFRLGVATSAASEAPQQP